MIFWSSSGSVGECTNLAVSVAVARERSSRINPLILTQTEGLKYCRSSPIPMRLSTSEVNALLACDMEPGSSKNIASETEPEPDVVESVLQSLRGQGLVYLDGEERGGLWSTTLQGVRELEK